MNGNKDRGMMKWAPYKSLIEQEDALSRAKKIKEKVKKPELSPDVEEEINRILVEYHNQEVKVTYWKDGFIYEEVGQITSIDPTFHQLRINRKLIDFVSLVNIEEIEQSF